jgi:hypothetical protein
MELRWTRIENGIYITGLGFRIYATEGGKWALTQNGKAKGRFDRLADAKWHATRLTTGR